MDFEIEEDGYEDKEIEFEWSRKDNKKNDARKNSNNKQFFSFQSATSEVDNSDDYTYDFPVTKNSSTKPPAQQSKVPENSSDRAFSDNDRSIQKSSEALNSYKESSNENALEKAQQMLNKYSNKTFGSVSTKPVIARKFDEDDLSLDSEEDDNEKNVGFNESEESDSFNDTTSSAKNVAIDTGTKVTKAPTSKLGKQKSVSLEVSVFEGEDDDGPDEPITPYAFPSTIKKSMKDDDEEEEEYSEESFDEIDEVDPSKLGISISKEEKSRSTKQRQQDNDNTSFSRIDYDGLNESVDEVEEDELDEVSTSHRSLSSQAGKPKILTFADLSAQGSWSMDDAAGTNGIPKEESVSGDDSHGSDEYAEDNFENSQIQGDPLTAANKVAPSKLASTFQSLPPPTATATSTDSTRYHEAVAKASKEVSEVIRGETRPSVPTVQSISETTKPIVPPPQLQPQVNQESHPPPLQQQQQFNPGPQFNSQSPPYVPSLPQQQQYQQHHQPHSYQQQLLQEPSAQQSLQSSAAGAQHYPPYPPPYPVYPYGQPMYPPYSPYPQYLPTPPQSGTYSAPGYPAAPYYPPPPPPMPQYYPYPPPSYNPFYQQYPPFPGYPPPQESQYGSLRASSVSSIGGIGGKMGAQPNSSVESLFGSQQQPIMVDLLQELRKSKEEAEWAKHKLAETIMLASKKDRECQVLEQTLMRKSSALSSAASLPNKPGKAASPPRFPKQGGQSPRKQKAIDEGGQKANTFDEDEGNDKEDEGEDGGDYSSDFEESNASFRGSPRSKQRGGQTITTKETGTEAEKKKKLAISVEDNYGREVSEAESEPLPSARESQPFPPPSYSSSIPSSASLQQPTHWPGEVREENSDSVLRAEMALQPLRSSLAKSLLSSQMSTSLSSYGPTGSGSIGTRRESPWLRATQSDSIFNEPVSVPDTGNYKPVPSLAEIKSQFKARKDENIRKLFDVITQVYPNMDKLEAIKLAEMF